MACFTRDMLRGFAVPYLGAHGSSRIFGPLLPGGSLLIAPPFWFRASSSIDHLAPSIERVAKPQLVSLQTQLRSRETAAKGECEEPHAMVKAVRKWR